MIDIARDAKAYAPSTPLSSHRARSLGIGIAGDEGGSWHLTRGAGFEGGNQSDLCWQDRDPENTAQPDGDAQTISRPRIEPSGVRAAYFRQNSYARESQEAQTAPLTRLRRT